MDQDAIIQAITERFAGVDLLTGTEGIAAGDRFFYYDPDRSLDPAGRWPFATIVTKDYGEYDNASNLDRPDVFRLNIGVSQGTFRSLFGSPPRSAEAADAEDTPDESPARDYTVLDQLLPHPVYAPQSWVCVLNPSQATFDAIQPLLTEGYERAVKRYHAAHEGRAATDVEEAD